MKIDFKELVKMVEEVSSKDYQKSDRIKTHASRRMSTKGKTNKVGKPYSQDPPTARTKSAPPGFGFTMEELYKLIDEVLEEVGPSSTSAADHDPAHGGYPTPEDSEEPEEESELELLHRKFPQTMKKTDPEKVAAVVRWAMKHPEKDKLEVVEPAAPGKTGLRILVAPKEEGGKKVSQRDPFGEELVQLLEPLGASRIYDQSWAWKFAGERGKSLTLYVFLKDSVPVGGGSKAAKGGMDREAELASVIEKKYSSEGIQASSAGAGHGSDLTIKAPNKDPMTIEVKTSLGADFGQFTQGYDEASGEWKPIKTQNFMKQEGIYGLVYKQVVGPYMNQNAQFDPNLLASPNLNRGRKGDFISGLKPMPGTNAVKVELSRAWFSGKESIYIPFDFSLIADYYRDKGDRFIQIDKMGKGGADLGLYALTPEDAADIGVPLFRDLAIDARIRLRIKSHGSADSRHSFTVAIKMKASAAALKTPLSLSKPEDLDIIIQRYKD